MQKIILSFLCSFCALLLAFLLVIVFDVSQDRAMSILQAMGVTAIAAAGWYIGVAISGEGRDD